MIIIEILSWVCTVLACIGNIPQILKIYRTKGANDLSLSTNLMWLFIVIVMFLRALLIVHDLVFIISQGAQFIIMAILISAIFHYQNKNRHHSEAG